MADKKKAAVESAAPAADKKKALETAMAQIEKAYGKGSIMRLGQGRDAAKQYLKDNPEVCDKLEADIRRNAYKLMSSQARAAAKAAGRAVDISAEDFEDADS